MTRAKGTSSVAPPSAATLRALRAAVPLLRRFGELPFAGDEEHAREGLQQVTELLQGLRTVLEALLPWFQEFVGSSLVVTVARQQLEEVLEQIDLHLVRSRQPATRVVPLVAPLLPKLAERLDAVAVLLPGYVELVQGLADRERPLRVRLGSLPPKLRRRFYVSLVFGILFLLSFVAVMLVLFVPSVSSGLGVAALIHRYAPTYAGVIALALVLFAGVRLVLGSIWLSRGIHVLPEYEGAKVEAAKEGIRSREGEVLRARRRGTGAAAGSEGGQGDAQGVGVEEQDVREGVPRDPEAVQER